MADTSSADRVPAHLKPLFWVASSRKNLKRFPRPVRQTMGQALFDAQTGSKHPGAKPLKGFGGAGVLEIVDDYLRSTYRAVYTVKFAGVVYVLHAFQKKSTRGIKTPATEIAAIRARMKEAEKHHGAWSDQEKKREKEKP